ncbi:MAG: class I SAM-dependent methyltransferase [Candidatus Paceibacterota bacterium]|jgi:methionine biosynthesis protein MetW
MNVKEFENQRWSHDNQKVFFRHKAALDLVLNEKSGQNISVLDLGCGDGLFLSLLKEKGIKGKGLDISIEGVKKAQEKGLDASIFDFSGPLPMGVGYFDIVVALDVLEHLYDPQKLLLEASKIAKKSVIIGVPNFNSLPARLQVMFGRVPENNRPNKGHVYWFNLKVLKKMAEKTGLKVSEIRTNAPMSNRFIIGKVFQLLAKTWPSMFALSFVVRMEKINLQSSTR